jgi:hypothetical protein
VRRRLLIAVVATLSGVAIPAIVALALFRGGFESGGPLASPRETSVTTHARPGAILTWGTVLPTNPTAADIVIESIEPSAPAVGLTILGLGVSDPRRGAVGTAATYPPPGITPTAVPGSVITARDGPSPFLQVVVGFRLDDQEGRIEGLRIRYATAGRRYETVLFDALIVEPPESSVRHDGRSRRVVGPDAGRSLAG